eukprot:TRINITY_DN5608_c0_g1_i1.p1 TRINITY_DN5608_c0_g1~~TRINITY_DN5608_c0_g1_i1.p1  ORF type:complete len:508 (+),score=131.08 TRINITY_DN5608_c0_g1_i1:7-1530(+)
MKCFISPYTKLTLSKITRSALHPRTYTTNPAPIPMPNAPSLLTYDTHKLSTATPPSTPDSTQNDLNTKSQLHKEKKREYFIKNRTKLREQRLKYYLANKPKIQEQHRQYRLLHLEKIKKQIKDYVIHNKDSIKLQQKEYRKRNKEAINAQKRIYRINNRDAIKAKKKVYNLKNKEALSVQQKWYRLKNKEAIEKYRQENKEKIRLQKRKYYLKNKKPRKSKVWTDQKEVREFFEYAKGQLYLEGEEDWYRVSRMQMNNIGGGSVFMSFGNLGTALQFAYPEIEWDLAKFSARGKKSSQRWLRVNLQEILPEKTDVFEDFLHPDLFWEANSKSRMELDIWVPKFQLALEYQGEHHFYDLCSAYGPSGTLSLYSKRDEKKKQSCLEKGITLVTVPYWWDRKKESLCATLHQVLPLIFPETHSLPIPTSLPSTISSVYLKNQISHFLMHGKEWNKEQDPTGWIISEKLDGFRAFWNGYEFFSKNGHTLSIPSILTNTLPSEVCLDGELCK